MAKKHPGVKVYTDWRVMFDKEKFDSVNVSTPDHMHAAPTMRAIHMGKAVYTQKPLTQTIFEARKLADAAAEKKTISQMGIQIHSASEHKTVVETIHSGAIGKVKEVHAWQSGRMYWILTDDPSTNKFTIPNGTTIPAKGFVTFNQNQLSFGLDAAGLAARLHPAARGGQWLDPVGSGRIVRRTMTAGNDQSPPVFL
jgi:predicted dehydrogenase